MENNSIKMKTKGMIGSFLIGLLFITAFFTGCWYALSWICPFLSIHFSTVFHAFFFTGGMILFIPFFFAVEVLINAMFQKMKRKPSVIAHFITKLIGALVMILVIMQLDKWVGGMEFSNLGAVVIGFTLFLFTEFIIGFSSNLYVVANRKNEKQKREADK